MDVLPIRKWLKGGLHGWFLALDLGYAAGDGFGARPEKLGVKGFGGVGEHDLIVKIMDDGLPLLLFSVLGTSRSIVDSRPTPTVSAATARDTAVDVGIRIGGFVNGWIEFDHVHQDQGLLGRIPPDNSNAGLKLPPPLFRHLKRGCCEFSHGLGETGVELEDDLSDSLAEVFVVGPADVEGPFVGVVLVGFGEGEGDAAVHDGEADGRV